MIKKRIVSFVLAAVLSLSLLPAAAYAGSMSSFRKTRTYDGRFRDISGWYTEYVIAAYESELINGTGDTAYSPDSTLKVSAAVTLAARIHKLYNAGNADFNQEAGRNWYKVYYDYCIANGIFTASQVPYSSMDSVASRNQVIVIMNNVLPDSEFEQINLVEDGAIPDVPMSDANAQAIYKFYRAGVLTGGSYNKFNGTSSILRREIAAIVTRLTELSPRSKVTLTIDELYKNRTDAITVDGKAYYIGMSKSELDALAGEAIMVFGSTYSFTWYAYCSSSYDNTFLAGVSDGKVQALCAVGTGFRYCGSYAGSAKTVTKSSDTRGENSYFIEVMTDKNDSNTVHGVYLISSDVSWKITEDGLYGECLLNFLLVNAFRRYHGVSALYWDDAAAQAAADHSYDMAVKNYFDHSSLDGRNPGNRLTNAGVTWKCWGENICAGYADGAEAYNGWVNSSGHRNNMLDPDFEYLGVGSAYNGASGYYWFWTQDFYA